VIDLCSRCLHKDPLERPPALVAALLLAEAVDARVYVPIMDLSAANPRPAPVSAWTERAAEAETSMALPAEPDPVIYDERAGRHRA
jgi:serine/threonine-protein kinase